MLRSSMMLLFWEGRGIYLGVRLIFAVFLWENKVGFLNGVMQCDGIVSGWLKETIAEHDLNLKARKMIDFFCWFGAWNWFFNQGLCVGISENIKAFIESGKRNCWLLATTASFKRFFHYFIQSDWRSLLHYLDNGLFLCPSMLEARKIIFLNSSVFALD